MHQCCDWLLPHRCWFQHSTRYSIAAKTFSASVLWLTTATLMLISTQYQVQCSFQDIPCISAVHVHNSDYCHTDADFTLICVQRGTDGDQNPTVIPEWFCFKTDSSESHFKLLRAVLYSGQWVRKVVNTRYITPFHPHPTPSSCLGAIVEKHVITGIVAQWSLHCTGVK